MAVSNPVGLLSTQASATTAHTIFNFTFIPAVLANSAVICLLSTNAKTNNITASNIIRSGSISFTKLGSIVATNSNEAQTEIWVLPQTSMSGLVIQAQWASIMDNNIMTVFGLDDVDTANLTAASIKISSNLGFDGTLAGPFPDQVVSSAIGNRVIDVISNSREQDPTGAAVGAGQTAIILESSFGDKKLHHHSSHEDGASSVTMQWNNVHGDVRGEIAYMAMDVPTASPPPAPAGVAHIMMSNNF